MAEFRAVAATRLRRQFSATPGHVVHAADRNFYGQQLFGKMAYRNPGDFCSFHAIDTGRPGQHVADGGTVNGAVL